MCVNNDLISLLIHTSLPYFIVFSACYSLFWVNKHALMIHLYLLCQTMLIYMLKELFQMERPNDMNCGLGHAFPSWHTVIITFLTGYYFYLFYKHNVWEHWGYLMTILRVLTITVYFIAVIVFRIPHYNYMTYIIASIILGVLFNIIFILFTRKYQLADIIKHE